MKKGILFLFVISLFACQETTNQSILSTEEYSEHFNATLDSIYHYEISLSPVSQTYEGLKTNNDKWDVNNDSTEQFYYELMKSQLQFLQENFDSEKLNHQAQITYRLYTDDLKDYIYFQDNYNDYYYPVNQMFGSHTWFPEFLMNVHTIDSEDDARAWLMRLGAIDTKIDEVIIQLEKCSKKGIIAPKFVYPYVIDDCSNLLVGTSLSLGPTHPLLVDFENDINELDLSDKVREELMAKAQYQLDEVFAPSYQKLIDYVTQLSTIATDDAGVWKFKNGEQFYLDKLAQTTTTDYTPQEIFDIGMSEIERIHKEMQIIMEKVEFEGTLHEFFDFVKTNPDLYYPNTDEGREAYLAANIEIKEAMEARLDELFITKPKAELEVRRVEPFREKSAGTAFYNSAAPDGSRPGIYYANLYDMSRMPKYEMEALTYHEAIPGHHMQISIAQELTDLPLYRTRDAHFTAYSEGWGLYSEYIPKEMGFYQDPYSDFGRLSMELFRAVRLVVDVGIHAKQWTREQGIEFYKDNTPSPEGEIISMVERHIVMPSQATAYKIGQLKILNLKDKATQKLGEQFDIREFHEVVLTNGAVPLNVLEELVDKWIAEKAINE